MISAYVHYHDAAATIQMLKSEPEPRPDAGWTEAYRQHEHCQILLAYWRRTPTNSFAHPHQHQPTSLPPAASITSPSPLLTPPPHSPTHPHSITPPSTSHPTTLATAVLLFSPLLPSTHTRSFSPSPQQYHHHNQHHHISLSLSLPSLLPLSSLCPSLL